MFLPASPGRVEKWEKSKRGTLTGKKEKGTTKGGGNSPHPRQKKKMPWEEKGGGRRGA